MKNYRVIISPSAEQDIDKIVDFLITKLSNESSYSYVDMMIDEVESLSIYADCFTTSKSEVIRAIHPNARRMISHNHKWNYIFHIEVDIVIVDRILASKMIKN